jgi:hypothetical protein
MKRIITSSLIGAAFLAASSAWAYTKPLYTYSSTMHPSTVQSNLMHPPTDITVINASSSYIYAVVPNSPVNDYITPGYNDHIYNYDPSLFWTYLVLQDTYRTTFYAQNVCREAIVTVYGYTGHFTINVDSDLCK